jgi:hypothetical protein
MYTELTYLSINELKKQINSIEEPKELMHAPRARKRLGGFQTALRGGVREKH